LAFTPEPPGRWRVRLSRANRQPAAAFYLQRPGDTGYHATALQVLRVEAGLITEIAAFRYPHLFTAFQLPPVTE
jgi:RNA polymerase sigma-70 factor (ECF subfamily)